MKVVKKSLFVVAVIFVVTQFFRPQKNTGNIATVTAFEAETKPPASVKNILRTSCYDCHSSSTNYPWYNVITPVNYWLESHIKDGKKHLNFSKWNTYSLKRKEHKMDELHEEVAEGKMPLDSYTWTHADANLTPNQIAEIVTWAKNIQQNYKQQLSSK
ncbi:heme-binding domain-containing protein [Polaribacter tangerinus]|uniref:heme-binding domain-containing protein n=1 Tax=Polaribacter tangerinus TaxID=1920034 RepID=UPI000B4B7FB3|nr:heme-binding domain-containing protein [Polaribacter tangerinus]